MKAGSTIHACIVFAWKPTPTQTPAKTRERSWPCRTATWNRSAASTKHMASAPSSMPCPNIEASTGVKVNMAAATMPAAAPAQRRTIRYITRTDTTPSTRCGRVTDHWWKPKSRAESACTTNAPGILSRVMVAAGSIAPKSRAFQLTDMLFTLSL